MYSFSLISEYSTTRPLTVFTSNQIDNPKSIVLYLKKKLSTVKCPVYLNSLYIKNILLQAAFLVCYASLNFFKSRFRTFRVLRPLE